MHEINYPFENGVETVHRIYVFFRRSLLGVLSRPRKPVSTSPNPCGAKLSGNAGGLLLTQSRDEDGEDEGVGERLNILSFHNENN